MAASRATREICGMMAADRSVRVRGRGGRLCPRESRIAGRISVELWSSSARRLTFVSSTTVQLASKASRDAHLQF
jgi:hypothetical protein